MINTTGNSKEIERLINGLASEAYVDDVDYSLEGSGDDCSDGIPCPAGEACNTHLDPPQCVGINGKFLYENCPFHFYLPRIMQ